MAYNRWRAGERIPDIAPELGVAVNTIEVYIIDLIADGQSRDNEATRQKLLQDLEVGKMDFDQVMQLAGKGDATLRQIKEETALKYNQIRAVIACAIRGTKM